MKILTIFFVLMSSKIFAEANYHLTCNMNGNVADVYVCNTGNSSEGNNEWVRVQACGRRGCESERELMYIYGAAGRCEFLESVTFDREHDYCSASF